MKLYTAKAIADMLDVSERYVRQLRDDKIITEYRPGLYKLKETNHAYINHLRGKNPQAEDTINYTTERAKLVKVKRESEELELQLRRNEVHTTEDIEKVMVDTLIKFKTRLMAIPAKLGPTLAKKKNQTEIFKLLKAAIDEALEELADFDAWCNENGKEEKDNGEKHT